MSRTILQLEHDEDDRYIVETIFNENQYSFNIDFVASSDEFFNYLNECGKKNVKLPSLFVLNYNAAPFNAVQILKQLKSNKGYSYIPVVVLSGSVNGNIVKECYDAGASSFAQKPSKSNDTDMKIRNFFQYWFETVELP
jgi:CheY-like chemotaxis protein